MPPIWILFLVAGTPGVAARQAPAPAIAVIGFHVDSGTKISADAIGEMSDRLALDLVESGRFRVMDREWFGPEILHAPLARARDAASAAGVDYVVVGRISKFTEQAKYIPPAPRVQRPFGQSFGGYTMVPVRPVVRRTDYLRVSLEIVDARTGSVLTETSSTTPVPPKAAPRVPAVMLLPASPVAAAIAAVTSLHRKSPAIDPGLARAVTAAGRVIARWTPPNSNHR